MTQVRREPGHAALGRGQTARGGPALLQLPYVAGRAQPGQGQLEIAVVLEPHLLEAARQAVSTARRQAVTTRASGRPS